MTKEEIYLQGIFAELDRVEKKNGAGVFRMNAKIPDNTAKLVKRRVEAETTYEVQLHKCKTCTGQWDIIIYR